MKPRSNSLFVGFAIAVLGLTLTGCQQSAPPSTAAAPAQTAPAQPAPTTTTESTSSTKSTEVRADPNSPDASAEKTVTHESTTTTRQQQ
jgi:hypothetical protein